MPVVRIATWTEKPDFTLVRVFLQKPEALASAQREYIKDYARVKGLRAASDGLFHHAYVLTKLLERDKPEVVEAICQKFSNLQYKELKQLIDRLTLEMLNEVVTSF